MMFRRRSRCSERRLHTFGVRHFQCTVNLIGRDMVEAFAFIFFRQAFPVHLCSLKQTQCTHYVGTCKGKRIFDTAVYMTFSCQMNNTVYVILLHQLQHLFIVADVGLYKRIVRFVLYIFQVGQISCISQLIQIDDAIFRIFVYKQTYYVTADEARSTGYYDIAFKIFHDCFLFVRIYLSTPMFVIHTFSESVQ